MTEIGRLGASKPVRLLVQAGLIKYTDRVLDYGCGRGGDVRWLRAKEFPWAYGYDPWVEFGASEMPEGPFDVVYLNYVVGTLSLLASRLDAIGHGFAEVKPEGLLVVTSRTCGAIRREARLRKWEKWGDGYLTRRRTFQKGHNQVDLRDLMSKLHGAKEIPTKLGSGGFSISVVQKTWA